MRLRAFTLIELILVLAVISTVLMIASPSLRGFTRSRQTADAAGRILAMTSLARSQAAAQGVTVRLYVDAQQGSCQVRAADAVAMPETGPDAGRRYQLDDGLSISLTKYGDSPADRNLPRRGEGWGDQLQPAQYIEFGPDGRAEMAVIEVSDSQGRTFSIQNASCVERYRIVGTGEVQP